MRRLNSENMYSSALIQGSIKVVLSYIERKYWYPASYLILRCSNSVGQYIVECTPPYIEANGLYCYGIFVSTAQHRHYVRLNLCITLLFLVSKYSTTPFRVSLANTALSDPVGATAAAATAATATLVGNASACVGLVRTQLTCVCGTSTQRSSETRQASGGER